MKPTDEQSYARDILMIAREGVRENLKQCCSELRDWQKTGRLAEHSKLEELSKVLDIFPRPLSIVESIINEAALDFVSEYYAYDPYR